MHWFMDKIVETNRVFDTISIGGKEFPCFVNIGDTEFFAPGDNFSIPGSVSGLIGNSQTHQEGPFIGGNPSCK